MRNSLYDDTSARMTIVPVARAASATVNGTAVDMAGNRNNFRTALLTVTAGSVTDGSHSITIEESDTGVGAWTTVAAGDLSGTSPIVIAAAGQNAVYRLGYNGGKRFLRAVMVSTGTTVGGTIGANFLLSGGSGRAVT